MRDAPIRPEMSAEALALLRELADEGDFGATEREGEAFFAEAWEGPTTSRTGETPASSRSTLFSENAIFNYVVGTGAKIGSIVCPSSRVAREGKQLLHVQLAITTRELVLARKAAKEGTQ